MPHPEREQEQEEFHHTGAELSDAELRALFRKRALALAREPAPEMSDASLELVEFMLAGERYAIESRYVDEVQPLTDLTPLPCTPGFVLGIVNIRGKILSVLDLRQLLELPGQGLSDQNKVIVVRNDAMEFGILADAILAVRQLPLAALQPTLPTLTELRADYLRGVTGERLVVLAAERLLTDRRLVVHDDA